MAGKTFQHVDISDLPALVRLAEEVKRTQRPAVLHRGSEELAVLTPSRRSRTRPAAPVMADPSDIWGGYDPLQVQRALAESAGAFEDLDSEAFLGDLAAQRQQDSSGRPSDA